MATTLTRGKRRLYGGVAAGLTVALGLAAAELVLRSADGRWRAHFDNQGWLGRVTRASDNPRLVWEYAPGARSADEWGPIVTNGYGFRDRDDIAVPKPPGTRRVMVLGDSVTLGMFVREEETFVRRTESLLRAERGMADVEVLNVAVDGYDAAQVAELSAAAVPRFTPDLVVYALCLNDFDDALCSGEKMRYFRPPRSFVLDAAQRALAALAVRSQGYHRYVYGRRREAVWAEVRRMHAVTRAAGAELCVAVLPLFPIEAWLPAFSTEPSGSLRAYPAQWAEIRDGVLAFLAGEAIPALDLVPAFADVDDPKSVALDIWHPNAAGHARIAGALAPFVAQQL